MHKCPYFSITNKYCNICYLDLWRDGDSLQVVYHCAKRADHGGVQLCDLTVLKVKRGTR